jgi:gluconokinase
LRRDLILAIDVGTSSVRAALYDRAGEMIPQTLVKTERRLDQTTDGGSEIDAAAALRQVTNVIDEITATAAKIAGDITHVAQCSFWHSLVGIDDAGKPTTKVLSWADNRSRGEVALLRKRFNEAEVHDRTGARFHSSFWPAKLRWIKRTDPEAFGRTDMWLSLSDYVALKLFGSASTGISMASATGLFDIRKCEWDAPLVRSLKIKRSSFPAVVDRGMTHKLHRKYARRWPRLADAEWFPAIGDGAANNIGSGCVAHGRAALMIGTSGAMRTAHQGELPAKLPSGLWCYRIDKDRSVIGGALSDGGNLIQWMKDNLRLPPDFQSILSKREPDSHGLTFLPFLSGERSTGYHENARASIIGLNASTDGVAIAQAAMEAVAYRFAEIFDQLSAITQVNEIVASGGAIRASPVWAQMIADVLGREIRLADAPEASLRGAVLLALETIGNIEVIEQVLRGRGRILKPNMKRHAIYANARARLDRFYDLTFGDE